MLRIHVSNESQDTSFVHPSGPLDFGRVRRPETVRFVVDDNTASRDQLRIEELPGGERIRAINLSSSQPVTVDDGSAIDTGQTRELPLPVALSFGLTLVEVAPATADTAPDEDGFITLPEMLITGSKEMRAVTRPAAGPAKAGAGLAGGPAGKGGGAMEQTMLGGQAVGGAGIRPLEEAAPGVDTMARWLETILILQRSTEANDEFYGHTANALVEMVGLDVGMLLLKKDDGWQIAARHAANEIGAAQRFSRTVLNRVLAQRRTFYQDFTESNRAASLQNAEAVVASPVFGVNDQVVGALYGMRALNLRTMTLGIKPLQAQLVQLLASAVGATLARTTAIRTRIQFEQFFSPELVRELERDPKLLEGRSLEVTILVSDLRGFTALSERLKAQDTCALIRDLMEVLSNRIVEHGGVIVDYAGDGILAMWNAPVAQPDHAVRACRAALAMQAEMPGLNEKWSKIIGGPLNLGVGVNTGNAQVGNTGSTRKLKYGPHGYTVNLASRVQDATKKLGVPFTISGSVRERLPASFLTRRICRARLAGINQPVDLLELVGETPPNSDWIARRDSYEAALAAFEAGKWEEAGLAIRPLLPDPPGPDQPTLNLARRLRDCLKSPPATFDPVLDLTAK